MSVILILCFAYQVEICINQQRPQATCANFTEFLQERSFLLLTM
jgi:hypothetical protein